ncbi:hypothetical protein PRZ48_012730 [Zasmidium cellare]|uniref:BTB domain-containing protein n=1 Tax=Zasmidium cellare TaxID=395010 RepID=A0ABR0E5Q3_ZASCE|nr:hypothetical protein PRZ48_012730 [Zasmidium cellare]
MAPPYLPDKKFAYPLPKFNMDELYQPTMVTITVNNWDVPSEGCCTRNFTVQRELICRHSDYFRGAFEGRFPEARSKTITITDTRPSAFQTFMDFLFHNEIFQEDDDPTGWSWGHLFRCYIFGDKYDSRGFRNRVFEAIQTKLLMRQPCSYQFPEGEDLIRVWENTVTSDPLRKLLVHAYVTNYRVLEDDEEQLRIFETFPVEFTHQALIFSKRLTSSNACVHCSRDGDGRSCDNPGHTGFETYDLVERWCLYHQHDTDREREICGSRWEARLDQFFD